MVHFPELWTGLRQIKKKMLTSGSHRALYSIPGKEWSKNIPCSDTLPSEAEFGVSTKAVHLFILEECNSPLNTITSMEETPKMKGGLTFLKSHYTSQSKLRQGDLEANKFYFICKPLQAPGSAWSDLVQSMSP